MPRQLALALDQLQDLHSDDLDPYQIVDACPGPLRAYLESTRGWHRAGLVAQSDDRWLAARLWKERPELRTMLAWLVQNHPCDEFERIFCRAVEQGRSAGDVLSWLENRPRLEGYLRPFVVRRARRWWKTWPSMDAALMWARRFDGGDDAWHQAACTIYQSDLRRQRMKELGESFLRHDLETHGTITPWEGGQINRFLRRYETQLLNVMAPGMWWMSPPPSFTISDGERARWLSLVARASSAFAGEAWSSADDDLYARCLEKLDPYSRRCFLQRPHGEDEAPEVLTRVYGLVGVASETSMRSASPGPL